MHPILNIAVRIARTCGNILIQHYDRNKINNESKILKHDLIIKIITIIETKIINMINKSYPEHSVITHHKKTKILKNTEIVWIINALDGIQNFENNFPHFCISIAVVIRNITQISVIYDPIRNELFTSVKGQGAQLNGYRMRCKNTNVLKDSLIGLIYPYKNMELKKYFIQIINFLLLNKVNLRCTGCISLDCTYVAMGRLDYLFNCNSKPFLFTSGSLQIKESGGLISDVNGGHNYTSLGLILTGNPKLTRAILVKIRESFKNSYFLKN